MDDSLVPSSNVPEFSVGDLAFSLKRTLEETYGRVRVRGELSRVSIAGSGHMYSSLKDENACIDAVCWKGVMSKLSIRPEEGLEVIVTGRISTYPQRSNYQLIIESMELAGEGALLKMLEERKKKLAAEGLFSPENKRVLPFLPQVIGVVTSPSGAVIRDILHRLEDRFPRHVIVWPVLVQGQGAAEQVAAAIDGFQNIDEHSLPRPDLLIVARGGGSLEDLMPFNEEIVVRAVANSAIPVISAVGHETDTTLCDLAADRRAPTPTGAAEMAVPVRAQLIAQVMDCEQRLYAGCLRSMNERGHRMEALAARLGDPARVLEGYAQRLDMSGERLYGEYRAYLADKRQALTEQALALKHPKDVVRDAGARLERRGDQLSSAFSRFLSDKRQGLGEVGGALRAPKGALSESVARLDRIWNLMMVHASKTIRNCEAELTLQGNLLEAYGPRNVLNRGYALVRDAAGHVVQDGGALKNGASISVLFKDDVEVAAIVSKLSKPLKEKGEAPVKTTKQQSLF